MGNSASGSLVFGVLLNENEEELPWQKDEADDELQDWWRKVCGFQHKLPDPFGDDGNWLAELDTKEKQDAAWNPWNAERKAFDEKNPVPFMIEYFGAMDCGETSQILCISEKHPEHGWDRAVGASFDWGSPAIVDLEKISKSVTEEQAQALVDFCKTHEISYSGEPAWILSCSWG